MTKRLGFTLGAILLALLPVSSRAQGSGPLLIRAKFGQTQLNDTSTRSRIGSTQRAFEVDLGSKLSGGNSFLTIGYSEKRQGGRFLRSVPITLTNLGQGPLPFGGLYTTSGIGAYLLSTNGSSRTQYGGFFGMGLRLSGGLFAEAKYHQVNGDINGLNPNGLGILIGKQF